MAFQSCFLHSRNNCNADANSKLIRLQTNSVFKNGSMHDFVFRNSLSCSPHKKGEKEPFFTLVAQKNLLAHC